MASVALARRRIRTHFSSRSSSSATPMTRVVLSSAARPASRPDCVLLLPVQCTIASNRTPSAAACVSISAAHAA